MIVPLCHSTHPFQLDFSIKLFSDIIKKHRAGMWSFGIFSRVETKSFHVHEHVDMERLESIKSGYDKVTAENMPLYIYFPIELT